MRKHKILLIVFVFLISLTASTLCGCEFVLGDWHINYQSPIEESFEKATLAAATAIVYEANAETVTDEEMEIAITVLRNRLTALGFYEASVSRQGEKQILVKNLNDSNLYETAETLGRVAWLTFRDADGNIVLEGKDIKSASARYGPLSEAGDNQHYIELNFNDQGRQKFSNATADIAKRKADGTNYIVIMLDDTVISVPSVDTAINTANCIISGGFSNESETNELASLINSGTFPFQLTIVSAKAP